jgi:hypothetical protein
LEKGADKFVGNEELAGRGAVGLITLERQADTVGMGECGQGKRAFYVWLSFRAQGAVRAPKVEESHLFHRA